MLPQTKSLVAKDAARLAAAGADAGGKALRDGGRCQRPFPCFTALAAGAGWHATDCDMLSQACDKAAVLLPTHTRLSSCWLAREPENERGLVCLRWQRLCAGCSTFS